jgi:hypothetical protein
MSGGVERSEENKDEPDHAASPLQQEHRRSRGKKDVSWFGAKRQKEMEPTIGLEPMTCRLRIDCSTN